MSAVVESFTYKFSDLVVVGHRAKGRPKVTWYIVCSECKGKHMLRQAGPKIWHTSCFISNVEWTVTPAEYYVSRPLDLTEILGDKRNV